MKKPLIAIEHLENHLSRWIKAEYEHAKNLLGERLVVTNAGGFCNDISVIVGGGACFRESILQLRGVLYKDPRRVIVLDPKAANGLTPGDAQSAEVLVIGGILGDHPPRGRTWEMLTRTALKHGMQTRNLGPLQLSIDGAAYVAWRIAEGSHLHEIELAVEPVIEVDLGDGLVREIMLPYAYPVVDGRVLISEKVLALLRAGLGYEEYKLALGPRGGGER